MTLAVYMALPSNAFYNLLNSNSFFSTCLFPTRACSLLRMSTAIVTEPQLSFVTIRSFLFRQ